MAADLYTRSIEWLDAARTSSVHANAQSIVHIVNGHEAADQAHDGLTFVEAARRVAQHLQDHPVDERPSAHVLAEVVRTFAAADVPFPQSTGGYCGFRAQTAVIAEGLRKKLPTDVYASAVAPWTAVLSVTQYQGAPPTRPEHARKEILRNVPWFEPVFGTAGLWERGNNQVQHEEVGQAMITNERLVTLKYGDINERPPTTYVFESWISVDAVLEDPLFGIKVTTESGLGYMFLGPGQMGETAVEGVLECWRARRERRLPNPPWY